MLTSTLLPNPPTEISKFDKADIEMNPELDKFPELFVTIELICGAVGNPEPNITWFKDDVVLEGERARVLTIEEVQITDRGRYRCKAVNFDPNNRIFEDESEDVVVNIEGVCVCVWKEGTKLLLLCDRYSPVQWNSQHHNWIQEKEAPNRKRRRNIQ